MVFIALLPCGRNRVLARISTVYVEESQSFSSTHSVDENARLLAHLVPAREGEAAMPTPEQFLSQRQRYQPVAVPQHVSEEDLARDWTLSDHDRAEVSKHRKSSRLFVAIQLCAVRLYGRFCSQVHDLSPHIVHYLGRQLDLPPSLALE